ncbi:hypothetical protein ACWOYS_004252 [Vibrio parahaemolyticus]
MNNFFRKSFGGLTKEYYIRQFLFGLIFTSLFMYMLFTQPKDPGESVALFAIFLVNTLLYPYSRFVYEGIFDFIIGKNVFILPVIPMFIAKVATMFLCWGLSIFIAPIGLVFLHFYSSNNVKSEN